MENSPPPSTRLRPLSASGLLCSLDARGLFSGAFDLKDLPSLIVIALICGLERASASLALDALSPEQLSELFNGLQPSWSQIWRGMLPTAFLWRRQMVYWWVLVPHQNCLVWLRGMTAHSLGRSFSTQSFSLQRPYSLFSCSNLSVPGPYGCSSHKNHTFIMLISLGLQLLSIVINYQAVQQRLNISGQKTKLCFSFCPSPSM